MEIGSCEESLLEAQWSVTGRFHEQSDVVCIVEKDGGKGINPVAVGGGDAIAKVGRCVGKMLALDRGSFERKASNPINNYPVD
jgi:hypothetical protein